MRAWLTRIVEWASGTFRVFIERLLAVGVIQSGVVLAAQTFMALIPLLLAVTAIFPRSFSVAINEVLRSRFGLTGSTEQTVRQLVGSRDQLNGGITTIGTILMLVSATAFTRALQHVYEQAWGLPRVRGGAGGAAWLVGLIVYIVIIAASARLAGRGPPGTVLRTVIVVGGAVLLWWWTPFVLLLGRVRARSLLPGGLLTAAAMLVLGGISSIVVPRTIRSSERQYGSIGAVFAFESWLVVVCCTLVLTAVIGAVTAQLDGPIGRLARGATAPDGWRRAPSPRKK